MPITRTPATPLLLGILGETCRFAIMSVSYKSRIQFLWCRPPAQLIPKMFYHDQKWTENHDEEIYPLTFRKRIGSSATIVRCSTTCHTQWPCKGVRFVQLLEVHQWYYCTALLFTAWNIQPEYYLLMLPAKCAYSSMTCSICKHM